jgi:valyl-tRNA synthetase
MLLFRFVNMKEMAYQALRAVQEAELKIDPPEFEKTWYNWLHDAR